MNEAMCLPEPQSLDEAIARLPPTPQEEIDKWWTPADSYSASHWLNRFLAKELEGRTFPTDTDEAPF